MTSAGRILIIPKGNYDSSVTYEMLDLVYHNNTSWVAKKTSVGIEPTDANSNEWHKLCDSTDLTVIEQRLTALENKGNVDLSGYALKSSVESTNKNVSNLTTEVSGIKTSVTNNATNISNVSAKANALETSVAALQNSFNSLGASNENRNKLNYSGEVKKYYTALPYTCPSAGEVTVYIKDDTSSSGESYLRITKNDKPAAYLIFSGGGMEMASTFPVAKGDVINRNGAAGNISEGWITFTPYA